MSWFRWNVCISWCKTLKNRVFWHAPIGGITLTSDNDCICLSMLVWCNLYHYDVINVSSCRRVQEFGGLVVSTAPLVVLENIYIYMYMFVCTSRLIVYLCAATYPSRHMTSNQRQYNVEATSWRRLDVDTTLFSGCVPAGMLLEWARWVHVQVAFGRYTCTRYLCEHVYLRAQMVFEWYVKS